MPLSLVDSALYKMGDLTFMWIARTTFAIDPGDPGRTLLQALLDSPEYAQDYCSPFDPAGRVVDGRPVHGRWWLSAVTADAFVPTTAAEAERTLRSWAADQDWTEPGYRQPPDAQERLEEVLELLHTGSVLRLVNPTEDHEHPYGRVTGDLGFHEVVVVDRDRCLLHVLVATDD